VEPDLAEASSVIALARVAGVDVPPHDLDLLTLHGIPVGVKDVCYTRGVATEAGPEPMKGFRPSFDATVVERLLEGGAVIVGKTVTTEFAFGPTLTPIRNAWHQDVWASGSGARSGVAVAARSAFAAIGTETAGSLRAPAGVSGVVAGRPRRRSRRMNLPAIREWTR
jgi:Asp-tRNA(Asn)/Glu-tRNA(Gln) amidotransferase A subunit family amidase